jgi:hypothetical protein
MRSTAVLPERGFDPQARERDHDGEGHDGGQGWRLGPRQDQRRNGGRQRQAEQEQWRQAHIGRSHSARL